MTVTRMQHYRITRHGTVVRPELQPDELPIVFSYGAGLDSFFALTRLLYDPTWADLRRRLAMIIHSDLGAELPETQWHLDNVAIPMMQGYGFELTVIKPRVMAHDRKVYEDITDYYFAQAAIPGKMQRSCTDRFKIVPCQEAAKDLVGASVTLLGYDASEGHRVRRLTPKRRAMMAFPLYDRGLTRGEMTRQLMRDGYPVPIKSRCFWCIFSHVAEMEWLTETHPGLMDRAIALEEHMQEVRRPVRLAKGKSDICLLHKPLREIRDRYLSRRDNKAAQMQMWAAGEEATACDSE